MTNSVYLYFTVLSSGIADAKKKLQESLNDIMNSMKNVDDAVRNIIERIINDSKGKHEEIKDLLKKLMKTVTGSNGNDTDMLLSPFSFLFLRVELFLSSLYVRNHLRKERKLWIWSYLLEKSLMENFIFCAVKMEFWLKTQVSVNSSHCWHLILQGVKMIEGEELEKYRLMWFLWRNNKNIVSRYEKSLLKIGSKQIKLRENSVRSCSSFLKKYKSEVNQTKQISLRMKTLGKEYVMYIVNTAFKEHLRKI